jgi:hypothetical protein
MLADMPGLDCAPLRCAFQICHKESAMKLSAVLARRLQMVRLEIYGEHGGPLLAEALGVPARNWVRYESGATVPGMVLLRFIEIVGVEPRWLLTGDGERYRVRAKALHGPWISPRNGQGVSRLDQTPPAHPQT